jgi:predicted ATPase with chaperone activity
LKAGLLPAFNLVGLPETEVKDSRDRLRAALQTQTAISTARSALLAIFLASSSTS